MKKMYFIVLMFIPMYVFSQQIISDRKDIKELKEEVGMYAKVVVEVSGFKLKTIVETNSGLCQFYDTETKKAKNFNTDIDVFNYMYHYGWEFVTEYVSSSSSLSVKYLFRKRE